MRKSTVSFHDDDELLTDENEIADKEARNGLLQFDEVERLIEAYSPHKRFEATPDLVKRLNEIAIQGIRRSSGTFRNGADKHHEYCPYSAAV